MTDNPSTCLVILAGGQSTRMGSDKAALPFQGQRLIDRVFSRFSAATGNILLSAREDYGTGPNIIVDEPDAPGGPVGAIFSIAAALPHLRPAITGFVTVPVDAPFAPVDLIERLGASGNCTVAQDPQRIHPTFAHWRCDIVNSVRATHDPGERAPSLQWLARQCSAGVETWPDETLFLNINRPEDLLAAERHKKAGT